MNHTNCLRRCIAFLFILLSAHGFSQDNFEEPTFSRERGFYNERFELVISYNENDAEIFYTLDGTDPRTSSTAKIQALPATLQIDPLNTAGRDKAPGVVVRACAKENNQCVTKVATHTYLFVNHIEALSPDGEKPGPDWPDPGPGTQFTAQGMDYGMDPDILHDPRYESKMEDALLSIPTISLVTNLKNLFDPDSGIYVNALYHGRDWERQTSVELLNPDGSEGFQVDAGLRIRGAWGRVGINYKHAFRLLFRSEYGSAKLNYPLFGDEGASEFDNMDLRTSQNYSWAYYDSEQNTFAREVFSRDTQRDMNQPCTRSRYYHLYINGTYWGLYQTQERSEASYAASYLGGSKEDYDVVKVDVTDSLDIPNYHIEATDGNLDAYHELWEMATEGFYTDEAYYRVQGLNPDGSRNPDYPVLVDIDNLIDYMLCSFYVGDPDGPVANGIPNNFYGLYNRNNDRGFVFFRHDAEHSLMSTNINVTGPTNVGQQFRHFNPRWLHQKLAFHPAYCLKFYDHVYAHFFNGGTVTVESSRDRLNTRKQQIEESIIAESARWGDAKTVVPRTRDDDWFPAINWILDDYFPVRTDIVLDQLRNQGLYPDFDPPAFNLSSGIVTKGATLTISSEEGTVYYTTDGNDTHISSQYRNMYQKFLVPRDAEKRVLIPTVHVNTKWRYQSEFDDSSWLICNSSPGGIGYDLNSVYEDISFDTRQYMHHINSSCMIRIPFELTEEEINDFNFLFLRIQYDDGFSAYLNKSTKILYKNSPGSPKWNSVADTSHDGQIIELFDITNHLTKLEAGQNLLGIHALNVDPSDRDFFISVELLAGNTMRSSGPISASATEYTAPITIDRTTKIKARVYKNEQWSALNEISLCIPEGYDHLTITEIHYHPLDGEGINDGEFEFVELKNTGTTSLELGNMAFVQGIDYTFPSGTLIEPQEYLVLASNMQAFTTRYHFTPFDEFSGQLSNSGETLVLAAADSDTMITITYKDEYPWPNSADGSGYSLILKPGRIHEDPNDPDCWCRSATIHGSPGSDNTNVPAEDTLPLEYYLYQNYPNPFNASTTINFSIQKTSNVSVKIYNILGQEIETLLHQQMLPGKYDLVWNPVNQGGGIYFVRLKTDQYVEIKKMIFLK